jgi:hypothetical protein
MPSEQEDKKRRMNAVYVTEGLQLRTCSNRKEIILSRSVTVACY